MAARPGRSTGCHAGEAALDALRKGIEAHDGYLWIFSDASYRLNLPGTGDDVEGLYGRVAVPAAMTAEETDRLLVSLTAGWEHPLAWPALAKAAGADVDRHDAIVERYGL